MWKYSLVAVFLACVACQEPEDSPKKLLPNTEEWADNTFSVKPLILLDILKQNFHHTLERTRLQSATTRNDFLTFLESTRQLDICPKSTSTEKRFRKLRKQNPIQCSTERLFNGTRHMESLNEFINALAPYGNHTNRTLNGNCVFVMFYAKNQFVDTMIWGEFFIAASFYRNIQWVLVDSYRFYQLNADFGVVGLPTLMLFHQGKPARKYNLKKQTAMMITKFLWQNTNLEPSEDINFYNPNEFIMPPPNYEIPDTYLKLAWAFIILCLVHHFVQTATCKKFTSFIQKMWREHEHNA